MNKIPKSFKDWIWLTPAPSSFAPSSKWSNADMEPVPETERTWTTLNYVSYWLSDAFNVSTYMLASSMISVGLNWKEAITCIIVGHTLIAIPITLNGTIGARHHVSFPLLSRSVFGFWFSYFPVISRGVLACFWFAIQTYTGSECIREMIQAVWPSFKNFPNHLDKSSNITSQGILCYFIFWIIQFPFLLVSMQRIRYLFALKSILVPITALAMLIWAFKRTNGGGPIFQQESTISGSKKTWIFMSSLNSVLGNFAPLTVNIPDFTRYAAGPRYQYIQLLIIPLAFSFFAFVGIVVTSASKTIYGGDYIWDPMQLMSLWDNRAATFLSAFSLALATLGTNISANSISAANDFTALYPQLINMRRGQILVSFIGGWCLVPWNILASASRFLSFMSGYTIFIGPIAGIMIFDYWAVKRQYLSVPDLYRPNGIYRYNYWGTNWRALVALISGFLPTFPGFLNTFDPSVKAGNSIYDIAYLITFLVSGIIYSALNHLFPPQYTNSPL